MRALRRLAWFVAAASAATIALALPASAHVTVSAPGATQGGSDTIITFRVPTESDTLSTTGVDVQLPTDTPIASVLVQAVPGWTFTEKTAKLTTPIKTDDGDITEAVSEINWKADSAADGIKPGEFGEFVVIAGQLPDAPSITFKAVQTYSDNSQVAWIEVAAPGSSDEPEHPAPVLDLAKSTDPAGPSVTTTPAAAAPAAKKTSLVLPVTLAIIALVLGAAALGLQLARRPGRGL